MLNENNIYPPITVDVNTAAALIGVSVRTLRNWRYQGEGPAYLRAGGPGSRVLYRYKDIEKWIDSRESVGGRS